MTVHPLLFVLRSQDVETLFVFQDGTLHLEPKTGSSRTPEPSFCLTGRQAQAHQHAARPRDNSEGKMLGKQVRGRHRRVEERHSYPNHHERRGLERITLRPGFGRRDNACFAKVKRVLGRLFGSTKVHVVFEKDRVRFSPEDKLLFCLSKKERI